MSDLSELHHLVVVLAEDEPAADYQRLASRNTRCNAYHLTPVGEDQDAVWDRYLDELAGAGRSASRYATIGAFAADIVSGTLPEIAVLKGVPVPEALGVVKHAPLVADHALVAVALGGGETLDVEGLGPPGCLLLVSPWTRGGWVSEEVCDHTSMLQLAERWTGVRAALPAWRRRLCGDLALALDATVVAPAFGLEGRRPARPVPYVPWAEISVDPDRSIPVVVVLANAGPYADRAAHFVVESGGRRTHHTVPGSPWNRPKTVEVEIPVTDAYDVVVLGPNGFRRRFAGPVPGPAVEVAVDHYDNGNPAYPRLDIKATGAVEPGTTTLTLVHRAYANGTIRQPVLAAGAVVFRMNPWVTARGWYDLAITMEVGGEPVPGWVREYAGHTGTGNPSLTASRTSPDAPGAPEAPDGTAVD